jgi:hypothetical protein
MKMRSRADSAKASPFIAQRFDWITDRKLLFDAPQPKEIAFAPVLLVGITDKKLLIRSCFFTLRGSFNA